MNGSTFHDAAGNPIYERDARGTALWIRYDVLDRVTAEVRGASPSGPADVTYVYDDAASNGLGLLRSVVEAAGGDGVALGYDKRADVTTLDRVVDGGAHAFVQEYNALGLLPSGALTRTATCSSSASASTAGSLGIAHIPAATGNRVGTVDQIRWRADGQLDRLRHLGGALDRDVRL